MMGGDRQPQRVWSTPDEHPIIVDVGSGPAEVAAEIVDQLEERHGNDSGIEFSSRPVAGGETSTGERQ
jgi:hypothetical protein